MANINISNTLWNDTSTGEIAYAEQLKDRTVGDYMYTLDNADKERIPSDLRIEAFQNSLNKFFMRHFIEFQRFLHDTGTAERTIDSWHELTQFLAGISDTDGITLMNMLHDMQMKAGFLNIRMSEEVPGMLEAIYASDTIDIKHSNMDEETGALRVVYNFI